MLKTRATYIFYLTVILLSCQQQQQFLVQNLILNAHLKNHAKSEAASENADRKNSPEVAKQNQLNTTFQTEIRSYINFSAKSTDVATIVFGGMGSNCKSKWYVNFIDHLKQGLNESRIDCYENSMFGSMKDQCESACEYLKRDTYYSRVKQLNLVGVSQGGLMARSILEDCTINSDMKYGKLLTIGTPNMGVSEVPYLGCNKQNISDSMQVICAIQHGIIVTIPQTEMTQDQFASAGYVRNTADLDAYKDSSTFLAPLNNEVEDDKEVFDRHKQRFQSLNAAMFVEFTKDEIVFPPISEVFGQVTPETAGFQSTERKVEPMEKMNWYQTDALGLKTLNEQGKLERISLDEKHTDFSDDDIDNIFIPFLNQ